MKTVENAIATYLIKYKEIAIHQFGTLSVQYTAASYDVVDKLLKAPQYRFVFLNNPNKREDLRFVQFLATWMHVNYEQASQTWNDFVQDLQTRLQNCESITWNSIGIFQNENNIIRFYSKFSTSDFFPDISWEAVHRNDPKMEIQVGENIRTKEEMEELLSETQKGFPIWTLFIILLILAIATIIYFMYK